MCDVLMPPGVNPTAVRYISYHMVLSGYLPLAYQCIPFIVNHIHELDVGLSFRLIKAISDKLASLEVGAWYLTTRLLYENGRNRDRVDWSGVTGYNIVHIR
jgi:hypothetical protein